MHTGRVEYVEPLCGCAEIFLLFESQTRKCLQMVLKLRRLAGKAWQNVQQLHGAMIHIFDNDTSGFRVTGSGQLSDGARPMWAEY